MMTKVILPGGQISEDNYAIPLIGRSHLSLQLLLIRLLAMTDPRTEAKEEQIGQMAGVTAYLYVHVELSISSVEAQLNKYHTLLKQHFFTHKAALSFMTEYL
jgi:hypothetical protein